MRPGKTPCQGIKHPWHWEFQFSAERGGDVMVRKQAWLMMCQSWPGTMLGRSGQTPLAKATKFGLDPTGSNWSTNRFHSDRNQVQLKVSRLRDHSIITLWMWGQTPRNPNGTETPRLRALKPQPQLALMVQPAGRGRGGIRHPCGGDTMLGCEP